MIKLSKMDTASIEKFINNLIPSMAEDYTITEAIDSNKALEFAKGQIEAYLPQGGATKNNYFYNIQDDETLVGNIWITRREKILFISEIIICQKYRRKGYATKTFQKLENIAKEMNCIKIKLHVFSHNTNACKLYEKLGFYTTNKVMEKKYLKLTKTLQ